MKDLILEITLQTELIQASGLFESCMQKYFRDNEFRVYIKPTEFSEYAKTFKVIKPQKRRKRK